ncbi:MAG: peptide ABC transporter substrate-binding protein [Saccharospirillum sp.]|uniref:peptide ABC transporter substrate-binding protein n=1 Tax=Saccharospirillum sp. TaxID=2033801 RepID=UPI003297D5A3
MIKPIAMDWRLTLAATLITGVTLAGCSQGPEDTASQSSSSEPAESSQSQASSGMAHPVTGETLAEEQVFTYRALDESSSLDPQLVEDVDGSYIVRDLFEGLLNSNEQGDLIPGVAERYETEDNQTWTFHLRDNAQWSDGEPVTANDFVYAWRRAVDPDLASPYAWYMSLMALENVEAILEGELPPSELGVEAIDESTLRVSLSRPLPYFAQMVVHGTTFPAPQWVIEEHGEDWTKPGNLVGNGAFVLTEHVVNERLVRERNERYWDNENNLMDRVVTLVINDENQALNRYDAGELDKTDVPAGQYPRLESELPDEAHVFPQLCNYYYIFNNEVEPFDDPRVRQALSYAIDRNVIVNNVLQGGQYPAYTFTPALTAGFTTPDVEWGQWTQAERDARAVELLAEAGYGPENPLETSLLYNTDEAHRKVAIAVSSMWQEKLGVTATLENQEWTTFLTTRSEGDFDIARGAWCGDYNEASTFLDLMQSDSGYNDAGYASEEYDRLAAEAQTELDPGTQYTAMEELIAADMPNAPVYHYTEVIMLKPDVKGWPFDDIQQNIYSRNLYKVAN